MVIYHIIPYGLKIVKPSAWMIQEKTDALRWR